MPAANYVQAQRARSAMRREVDTLLEGADALVTPALAITPPRIDETTAEVGGKIKQINPVLIPRTDPFNLTGSPAIAVPCGFGRDGRPTGLQVVGRAFEEQLVLRIARAYEATTDWHLRRPPLAQAL